MTADEKLSAALDLLHALVADYIDTIDGEWGPYNADEWERMRGLEPAVRFLRENGRTPPPWPRGRTP